MTALPDGQIGRALPDLPSRLDAFIADARFDRPTLVIDTTRVADNHAALRAGLGDAAIHYAVKANPAPEVIDVLARQGANFDAASRGEIELCLARGVPAARISFGNTIKRASDVAFAHAAGITLFAADAEEEVEKIAAHAPGAQVYIRVIAGSDQADWPLARKFGCAPEKVVPLLRLARACGLDPVGLSFHVGSQTRRPDMWAGTLDEIATHWHGARAAGVALSMLNIGGGFPADYDGTGDHPTAYAAEIMAMVRARFGHGPRIIAEPGRGLVADAGKIVCEALLVARKSPDDLHRWVYLDIGRFSGLAETEGEAIRYPIATSRDGDETGPCILAGPTCDSVDVLYEKRPVTLPLTLRSGDRVVISQCGAYTASYASTGFNGFPPPDVIAI